MTHDRPEIGSGFVVKWIVAAAVGNILTILILSAVVSLLNQTNAVWAASTVSRFITVAALGALAGALLGSAEAYPLVKYISHPPHWILASAAGMAIGFLGMLLVTDRFILNVIFGAAIGVLQWRVLRIEVAQAGWWIPAQIVAWQVTGGIIFLGVVLLLLFRKTPAVVNSETTSASL